MGIRFCIQYTDDFIKKGMAIMNELRLKWVPVAYNFYVIEAVESLCHF